VSLPLLIPPPQSCLALITATESQLSCTASELDTYKLYLSVQVNYWRCSEQQLPHNAASTHPACSLSLSQPQTCRRIWSASCCNFSRTVRNLDRSANMINKLATSSRSSPTSPRHIGRRVRTRRRMCSLYVIRLEAYKLAR
jgi:hypothetical protein